MNSPRLAAIFIDINSLPHVFGIDHVAQTINLDGRNIYNFIKEIDGISLEYKINKNYIKDFFGDDINLVSAIVGQNGTGKTSILRLINDLENDTNRSIYIFELENEIFYHSFHLTIINENITKKKYADLNLNTLFYSPNIDFDLNATSSPINLVNYFEESLFEYHLNNITRHLFFLNNIDVVEKLKASYKNFPFYEKLIIKPNQLYKHDFEKTNIHSTLGNSLYKTRNNLLREVARTPKIFNTEEEVNKYFNQNATINEGLKEIFDVYKEYNTKDTHKLHDGKNFKKNLEINLLT